MGGRGRTAATGWARRWWSLVALVGVLGGSLAGAGLAIGAGQAAAATATIESVGFRAPVHTTYDHAVGGGAWNDGSVTYVKGELLGSNYACGDIATFMFELAVADAPTKQPPPYTARVVLEYTLDSTGRSGVALVPLTEAQHLRVNRGVIAAPGVGTGPGGSDDGFVPSGSGLTTSTTVASAPAPFVTDTGPMFTSGSVARLTFWVDGLAEGTRTIIRSDTRIYCQDGSSPTGNLQGTLKSVTVVDPAPDEAAPTGNQTVNFRGVGDLAGLSTPVVGVVKTVMVGSGPCPATPSGVSSISTPSDPVTVTYCYYVTNYAAVPALGVALVDDGAGAGDVPITLSGLTDQGSGSPIDLVGGGATTATGSYTTTIAGGGTYVNVATAAATNLPTPVSATATVVVQSGVVVTKTVTTGSCPSSTKSLSLVATGSPQSVRYCYRVTNFTGAPAYAVALTDDQAGAGTVAVTLTGLTDLGSGSAVDLAAGASATGELVLSLAGTGTVVNTATVGWDASIGGDRLSAASSATVVFEAPTPALTVAKLQTSSDPTAVGEAIAYTIVATNSGNTALTSVAITDSNATITSCTPTAPVATLAVGAAIECQARHVTTQADVDAGLVVNAATATGTGPGGPANGVTDTSADVITPIAASPALTTTKTRSSSVPSAVGDVISYTIKVRNTGNVTLGAVSVTDPNATVGPCVPAIPVTSLAPNDEITCVAAHTVTQADVDAGSVANTATATATAPGGPPDAVTGTSDEVVTPVAQLPELTITKTQTSGTPDAVGDLVTYTIRVDNTGNATLRNVSVADPNAEIDTCTETLPLDDFLPGAWFTCTATHTVTRADMNAGEIRNTADVVGTAPKGDAGGVTATSAEVVTPVTQGPALSITKVRSSDKPRAVGDAVTYTIVVTNVGNVDLTSVVVTDGSATLTSCTPSNPVATLAPDATITCQATHVVAQADLDAGSVVNRATVTGTAPGGAPGGVTSTSPDVVDPLEVHPKLAVTKSRTGDAPASVGALIHYTIEVTNTGDVTLTDVTVADPEATITECAPAIPVAALSPDAVVTCLATHTVTQADLDRGRVTNAALATATAPGGPPGALNEASNTVVTPVEGVRELTVTKSRTSAVPSEVGDVVTYTIVATNTGTVTLENVAVTDANASISACDPTTPVATLAPGSSISCTASHTVTNVDRLAGRLENTAQATGTPPGGPSASVVDGSPKVITPVNAEPAIEIVKTRTSAVPAAAGEVVTYALVVTNIGATELTDVTVADISATIDSCTPSVPLDSLLPGGSVICTASSTVTPAQVTDGTLTNTATVSATAPGGAPGGVTDASNEVVTPVASGPALRVRKSQTSGTPSEVGDVISYAIVATNVGNVTLANVTVADPTASIGTCTPVLPVGALEPGAAITCTASHAVTQADIDAGVVRNTATAQGTAPGGVTGSDDNAATVTQTVRLVTTIEGPTPAPTTAGQVVYYTVRVENVGNTTVTDVVPQVDGLVLSTCVPAVPATLLPGEELVCQANHTVSAADVSQGTVDVSATAAGTGVEGDVTSNRASESTYLPGRAPTPSSGLLAFTGSHAGWVAAVGVVAVAIGTLLVLVIRRRRRRE